MHRDPEEFRGLSPSQMLGLLLADSVASRQTTAAAQGASCVACLDTGMAEGKMCSCAAGSKLAQQAYRRD